MSRRTRIVLGAVVGAVVVVAAAAAFVFGVVLRDTAEPASVADAVARYRAAAAAGETPIPPGVYVYATTGEESISALGGTTHRYPARSTITVTTAPCGMTLRWDVLKTRTTTWEICAEGEQQEVASWVERHVFFGQDDRTTWRCVGWTWLPGPGSEERAPLECDGGDTTMSGAVEDLGVETLTVAGDPVATVHLRVRAAERGVARGPVVEDRWVESETGLPVRVRYSVRTANVSPIGDVTFTERFTVRLLSLEPRR
jgi:hypothetical protein